MRCVEGVRRARLRPASRRNAATAERWRATTTASGASRTAPRLLRGAARNITRRPTSTADQIHELGPRAGRADPRRDGRDQGQGRLQAARCSNSSRTSATDPRLTSQRHAGEAYLAETAGAGSTRCRPRCRAISRRFPRPAADQAGRAVPREDRRQGLLPGPPPDGSRPGIYYVNLYDMKQMPSTEVEALFYHEGIPGHHLQRVAPVAGAGRGAAVPPVRRLHR